MGLLAFVVCTNMRPFWLYNSKNMLHLPNAISKYCIRWMDLRWSVDEWINEFILINTNDNEMLFAIRLIGQFMGGNITFVVQIKFSGKIFEKSLNHFPVAEMRNSFAIIEMAKSATCIQELFLRKLAKFNNIFDGNLNFAFFISQ